jgi:hypothetical protein
VNNKVSFSLFGFIFIFLGSTPIFAETNTNNIQKIHSRSREIKITFPETPEPVKYSLTFVVNSTKTKLKSTEPYFFIPLQARILRLSAVRKNGTLARQYAVEPLQDQLTAALNQPDQEVSQDQIEIPAPPQPPKPVETPIDPLDETVLAGYENKASSSEKTSTEKLETELTDEIKRGKLQIKLGAELERVSFKSTLANQTLEGNSSDLAPTYELRQFFNRVQDLYSFAIGGRTTKLTLEQPVENTSSPYSEFYIAGGISTSPLLTFDVMIAWLKTPELAVVITEIDDVEHGQISSSSHVGFTLGARYQWMEKLESGIKVTPYISAGGGLGFGLFTNYEFLEYQKIQFSAGAFYENLKLNRKGQCGACTAENTTRINQLGLSFQASKAL